MSLRQLSDKKRMNTQGERTLEKILKSTIKCLAKKGFHNTSFQDIATDARVDQPLVVYHLKSKDQLFLAAWNYLYEQALKATVTKLESSKSGLEKLIDYFDVQFEFFRSEKEFTLIYLQLHSVAAFDDNLKLVNTQAKRKAINRIAEIIIIGQQQREFRSDLDPYLAAKTIHSSLVGVLVNSVTEFEDFEFKKVAEQFKQQITRSLMPSFGA